MNYNNKARVPACTDGPSAPIKIEAVTTCVGCADFLAHTLPLTKPCFDKIVVVTAPEDKDTKAVCDHWGVKYRQTDAFRTRWGEFNKGAGINCGLEDLSRDAWMVHLDCDIILPSHFRQSIALADLDTSMVYGIDRAEFKSYEDWQRFHEAPEPQIAGNGVFIHVTHTGQSIGTRVQFGNRGGWVPIGFFQMWHADSNVFAYPEGHTDAGREDSMFGAFWPRRKRGFIPEVIAWHLESENAPMAVNWKGRKTKAFGIQG
jgi:hypothetical protein